MELVIVTTDQGHIASVTYGTSSARQFSEEIVFVKEKYVMNGKFEGENAKQLNKSSDISNVVQSYACVNKVKQEH